MNEKRRAVFFEGYITKKEKRRGESLGLKGEGKNKLDQRRTKKKWQKKKYPSSPSPTKKRSRSAAGAFSKTLA